MARLIDNFYPGLYRWQIFSTFKGILKTRWSEGKFRLTFDPSKSDVVSFHWLNDSRTTELNFVITMKVEDEKGRTLPERSWQVAHMKVADTVDLPDLDIGLWGFAYTGWTPSVRWRFVTVTISDLQRVGHSGKTPWAYRITTPHMPQSSVPDTPITSSDKQPVPKPIRLTAVRWPDHNNEDRQVAFGSSFKQPEFGKLEPRLQQLLCQDPNCTFNHADYYIPVAKPPNERQPIFVSKSQKSPSTAAQISFTSPPAIDFKSTGLTPIVQSSTDSTTVNSAKAVAPMAAVLSSLPPPNAIGDSKETENHSKAATCSNETPKYVSRVSKSGSYWETWDLGSPTTGVFVGKFPSSSPGAELKCFYLKPTGHGTYSFEVEFVPEGVEIALDIRLHLRNQSDEVVKKIWWRLKIRQNGNSFSLASCDNKSGQICCETTEIEIKTVDIRNLRLMVKTDQNNTECAEAANTTSSNAAATEVTQQTTMESDSTKPIVKHQQTESTKGQVALGREMIAQYPAVVDIDANLVSTLVDVPLPTLTKLFPVTTDQMIANDAQMIQELTQRLSKLEEENLRMSSTIAKLAQTIAD